MFIFVSSLIFYYSNEKKAKNDREFKMVAKGPLPDKFSGLSWEYGPDVHEI